jgi:hypothetical protein
MEDDDLGCCVHCCFLCCICGAKAICNLFTFLVAAALAAVLIAAFAFALPVRATIIDASLSRLDLITGGNGTTRNGGGGGAASSLAYNLSLTVVVRNANWAMRAELTAPLDAELRFAGRRFDGARLAEAGRRIPPRKAGEFRVLAVSERRGVALGSGGAAEFARERAAGVFELELKLSGKVRYRPVHLGRSRSVEVTCPVKMLMAPAPANAPRGTHLMVFDKVIDCY